jgi:hypothetical protein
LQARYFNGRKETSPYVRRMANTIVDSRSHD